MRKVLFPLFLFAAVIAHAQSGITWSATTSIATSGYSNARPRLATDRAGNPLVIWGHSSNGKCYFSRWSGGMFTTPVALNTMPVFAASWAGPEIASMGDTVYVVFKQSPEDKNPSFITRSFNGGATFSTPVPIESIGDSTSRFPVVAIAPTGNPVVAFMKFNTDFSNSRWVVAKSSDMGNTFATDVRASGWSGGNVCDCCPGSIVTSGNKVIVSYRDEKSNVRDMWSGISTDGGASFAKGVEVDGTNWSLMSCPSTGADAVVIGDTLWNVYMSAATGKSTVYLSKMSLTSVASVTGKPVLGNFSGYFLQNYPRLASEGNAVGLAWKQNVPGAVQLCMFFTNDVRKGLPAWYDTVAINDINTADIAIANGNVYVVWQDDKAGTVKYRKGTFTPINTRVHELASQDFIVYPNPARHHLTIERVQAGNKPLQLTLVDLRGRTVYEETMFGATTAFDVSLLAGGIYTIVVAGDEGRIVKKIALENPTR